MSTGISEEQYGEFSRRLFSRTARDPQPTRVQFEITYRCNIHCMHCYTDPFNTPMHLRRELAVSEILRIFDELADAGVLWMTITGGEAFVHPQFKRIYQEAKARGFILHLFSNATVISEDLAEFLAADPPFTIDVSCHGATPETFEKVTQVAGSFRRFQDGIRRLLARGLPLKIKTKAMTVNRHELPKIKAFVESLGLQFNLYTTIHPRLNGDLSSTQYRLSPKEIVELELGEALVADEWEERCGNEGTPTSSGAAFNAPPDDRLFRCGCGTNTITINPYGILRACTHTTWPAFDLRTMDFMDAFGRLVEAIRQARYTDESPCRSCPVYTLCDKNPAMALHEAGSVEAPVKHFCDVAFGKAEKMGLFTGHRNGETANS